MRIREFAPAVVVSLALAGCGGGDSDNVMAAQANALSPAQVDLALGPEVPEVANPAANETDTANDVDTSASAEPEDRRPAPAPTVNRADEAPAEDEAEAPPTDDNSVEEVED